jgi:hypothetical protein
MRTLAYAMLTAGEQVSDNPWIARAGAVAYGAV